MSTAAAAVPADHSFFLRRVHSLTGIVPVGAYVIEHLFSNLFALRGPEAYNAQVTFLVSLPMVLVLEIVFIWAPILYHGGYGVVIWWRGDSNVTQYPWTGNWLYTLQRYSGLAAFAYIIYHTIQQRFTGTHLLDHPDQAFTKVAQALSNPLVFAIYVVGIVAVSFHFAYGIWLFAVKWGLTPGERAQRLLGYACTAFGGALIGLWLAALMAFV